MNRNRKIIMALAAASAVIFTVCVQVCLHMEILPWVKIPPWVEIPPWVVWDSSTFSDATGDYEVSLRRKTVSVKKDTGIIWTSPGEIKVQKALSCDIDNDGTDELVLLCWKKGRYGEYKPFWIEEDEDIWSQHLFVYEYSSDNIKPKWMSSYIGQDVADIISNGEDAPYIRLWVRGPQNQMSSWIWDSWGFTREDTVIKFTVFGDILVHEPIYRYGLSRDESFGFLFENVQNIIADSDVSVINQETPLTDNPMLYSDYPRFGTPVNVGQAIVDAGFQVVTCATNHALDQGVDGVNFSKQFFIENDITCLGIQTIDERESEPYALIRRNGVSFALFNYTYGTNGIRLPEENLNMVHLFSDEEKIRKDIAKARSETDFVIVFVHWGTEYSKEIDEFQQKWTQIFLDSDVDVVVGTHPHILQPYEIRTGNNGHQMLVYYSIGNFISAQPEKKCIKGGIANFTISLTQTGYEITEYNLRPLTIVWHQGGKYTVEL